jgi:PTH1 family peptidyl-tRNA hydrolase
VDFVLGKWDTEEKKFMEERTSIVIDMIRSFAFAGVELTMTAFNKAGKVPPPEKDSHTPLKSG